MQLTPRRALLALAASLCLGMGGPAGRLPPLATWATTADPAADLIVLDPEAGPPPARRGAQVRLARLSLGVTDPSRPYHRMVSLLPTAGAGQGRLDPRSGAWRGVLLGDVVPRYARAGWDGLYLTDLDVGIQLEAAGTHEGAAVSMAELVKDIRGLDPDLKLVAEGVRGFMPGLARYLDAIADRQAWQPGGAEALQAIRKETGLQVLVPADARARAAGFVPAAGGL